jgi:menaquinone-specific isochorismate synthase
VQEPSKLGPAELLAVAATSGEAPIFYWEKPVEDFSLLAFGAAWEIRTSGARRFDRASRAAIEALGELARSGDARFGPLVLGGFGFSDSDCADPRWREFPSARLWIPELLWVRRGGECRLTRLWRSGGERESERRAQEATRAASGAGVIASSARSVASMDPDPDERRLWGERVEAACGRIAAGELDKVVLARRRLMHLDPAAEPVAILRAVRSRRPSCFNFWIGGRETSFVGSSPERLVTLDGDQVTSGALAGSATRGRSRGEDERLGEALLACPKNRREHQLVVSAVGESLAPLCASLRIGEHPTLLRLPEAQHLSTAITGRLAEGRTVIDLAGVLHPTPAVCGVPRDTARRLIEQQEPGRGWFAGTVGWMSGDGSGEIAVALRSVLIDGAAAIVWAGAGIVSGSSADAEFLETEAKMNALFEALGTSADEHAA